MGGNDDTVSLVSPEGTPTDVPASDAQSWIRRGFRAEDAYERQGRIAAAQREADTSSVDAFGQGVARALTLGGSDVAQRLLGGEDARIYLDQLQRAHPVASTAGAIAGGFATPGVGALGAAIREGGGLGSAIAAGAAEGGIFGAGQGVSELALSDDPLTAEHVASVLSSNILLGGGLGGGLGAGSKLLDRGLEIAGDKLRAASGAREAVASLPEDLRGLDDAGLKDAYAAAKADHAADIKAEKASLEQIRVNQRAEMANRVKDLHEDLATEHPIFSALSTNDELTPELKGIEGVSDARVQLAKSYKSMRSAFDSPLSVERDPSSLIRPLEQRQAALETLQGKLPEMHAALAGDARAEILEHVDGALADTKAQIAEIRRLKETPVASGRLSQLEAGPSTRMQAIDSAREALSKAPELGLVGKGATGAAFAGVTALAHAIPGVGIAAPFVGKAASEAVERLFTRTAGAVGRVSEKATGAAQKFVAATKTLEPYAAPTAMRVLANVRFGAAASKGEAAEGDLPALFRARTNELYQQTMRQPDGTTVMRPEARAAMAAKLDPYRQANPKLADQLETIQARKVAYYASIAPKLPDPPAVQIGPDRSRPPDLEIRKWARAVRAGEHPDSVEERLARGIVTHEEAAAYRAIYHERFAALQREIFQELPLLQKTLPMHKKVALSIFTGIPVTPAMQPNVIAALQSTFDVEPGSAGGTQAPRPQPHFGALGSLKDIDKPTPAQERQQHP